MSFVHLHVASAYSAHYGASRPEELVRAAAQDGAEMLACTDRDGLYGAIKHVSACRRYGLWPILGTDLAVAAPLTGRIVLLGRGSSSGYAALCRAVSAAHAGTAQPANPQTSPQLRWEKLAELVGGHEPQLYVLLGPQSDVGRAAAARHYAEARQLLLQWRRLLGRQALRVEVVSHLAPPGEALSTSHAARMLSIAEDCGITPVLTNMVRFAGEEDAATIDVLDAVRVLSSMQSTQTLQPNGQGWLKPAAAMARIAEEICSTSAHTRTAAAGLMENTRRLAEDCALDPSRDMSYGTPKVPETRIIGLGKEGSAGDPSRELAQRCETGLALRFPALAPGGSGENTTAAADLRHRLDHELGTIRRLGFSSYFLTVAEVVDMIEDLDVRVAARGSGASSLVNYLLRISQVDPIRHGLVFERFLSERRSTLPDIDLDIESARRHEVYRSIFDRFGAERTTLMSMQNSYRIRGAVRDAGLALGLPGEQIDQIAEMMWRFPAEQFREALTEKPELRGLAARLESERAAGRQQLDLLVDLTERLDRLPRHISTHPCGIILGDQRLLDLTPTQPSGVRGLPMSQFDKHDMDPMGFLKLDVLGVRMQSTISYALQEVHRTTGERIELDSLDTSDPPTYQMIRSTETLGCFQIESPGQRELVGKLVPESLEDLILDISLFRPGPMESGMVTPYLERRHGFTAMRTPHPDLTPILAETYGVTVYHEQVLRIFDTMTGCGLDVADEFRRALGTAREGSVEDKFRRRAQRRNYSAEVIDEVWNILHSFGSFGFCKAHGAAFAVPTFESAWLKVHHPEAFLAGLFEHDPGMYPLRLLIAEARRMGVALLPMDVNRSSGHYRLEALDESGTAQGQKKSRWAELPIGRQRFGIRMALTSLKGMSQAELTRIVAGQPYDSLADFRDRARPRRPTLRALAKVGALDCFLTTPSQQERLSRRGDVVALVEQMTASAPAASDSGASALTSTTSISTRSPHSAPSARQSRHAAGQLPLPLGDLQLPVMPLEHPAPKSSEVVSDELALTGIDVTAHVMENHREALAQHRVTYAEDLLRLRSGMVVRVAGIRVATQTPPMASGRRVVFISLDDGTGCADVAFFEEAQEHASEILFTAQLMLVEGTVRRTGPRAVSIQALRAWDLRADGPQKEVRVPSPDWGRDTDLSRISSG